MNKMEAAVITRLEKVFTTAGYVDLLLATQMVGLAPLYDKALEALANSDTKLDLEQSRRIGIDATYEIMDARLRAAELESPNKRKTPCRHCGQFSNWFCPGNPAGNTKLIRRPNRHQGRSSEGNGQGYDPLEILE